jgi:demethylmenaquinone methyltransferase/2-methoxy-6-polyprenyl-1,4-benzoquinol methylase
VLDLCAGTAELAIAAIDARPSAERVVGIDFSREMLRIGQDKIRRSGRVDQIALVHGDATSLPVQAGAIDALTIGFGIRNVEDIAAVCAEMRRVLAPGGRFAILEFAIPATPVVRTLYLWYFNRVLPFVGRMISRHDAAYGYLPASVGAFASPSEFMAILRRAGFVDVSATRLTFGIVFLYTGVRG